MTEQKDRKKAIRWATRGMSIADKLDYYTYPEPNTGCWLWGGSGTRYGWLKIKGGTYRAHRLQWERFNGPIPEGLCVLHKCDVSCCINPEHLFLGTQIDNVQDALNKGRMARGERAGGAKLTEAQVAIILSDKRVAEVVAKDYGVGPSSIRRIRQGITWRHKFPQVF